MEIFKTMITDNNNEELRTCFFSQRIIHSLWPHVRNCMDRKSCFPNAPNRQILPTYHEITREMDARGLPMPKWW